jgi:hypothetical protein
MTQFLMLTRMRGRGMPGYDHSVPPGQRRSAPIRPIAVSPIRRFASLGDTLRYRQSSQCNLARPQEVLLVGAHGPTTLDPIHDRHGP